MLTPNWITALTVFGTPVLTGVFTLLMCCRQGTANVNQSRILVLVGNTFSIIPLACVLWNVLLSTYVSVLEPVAAKADTSTPPQLIGASNAVQGNETLLFLALFYAIFIIANMIRRDVWVKARSK